MRVFYVLYVHEVQLRSILDTIRLLYDPSVSHPAHITVRGPYSQRFNVNALSGLIGGQQVLLHEVGHFLSHRGGQHTVYVRAHSPSLVDVWKKTDFDFMPHLTLYDGGSQDARRTALELFQLVSRLPIAVTFAAHGLEPLVSGHGQTNLRVLDGIDFDFVSDVTKIELDRHSLFEVEFRKRSVLVERLCRYMSELGPGIEIDVETTSQAETQIGLTSGWSVAQRRGRGRARGPEAGAGDAQSERFALSPAEMTGVEHESVTSRMRDVLDVLWNTTGVRRDVT